MGVYAIDLHAHTRFFHGHPDLATHYDPYGYAMLGEVAHRKGLDGVALTNHDYYRPLGDPTGDGAKLMAIPGIEITTTEGHLLVVGPDPPTATEPDTITPHEAVELAHERGCAAIVPHPFRNSTVREADATFDAIEMNGKHPSSWSIVRQLADSLGLPLVGGSDAHFPFEVGRAYTLVDADDPTPEAIASAIRGGRVEPEVGITRLGGVMHRAYAKVHRYKGHTPLPVEPTPGIGKPPGEGAR